MEEARFLQRTLRRDVPVLDAVSGLGTFRPILGKFIYYRPGMFAPGFYESQNRLVAEALREKAVGAVADHWMLQFAPEEIQELVRRNYQASEEFPGVLLPRSPGDLGPP